MAKAFAPALRCGDRVLLEGPMGVGKTTFSRALLEGLGVIQPSEGSPTFALVHEYQSPQGQIAHMDFYRIRSETEIQEAGLETYFWERDVIVLAEWTSLWPQFECAVMASGRNWTVSLGFTTGSPELREIQITLLAFC